MKFGSITLLLQYSYSIQKAFGFYLTRPYGLNLSIKSTALKMLTPKGFLCVVMLMVCYQLVVLICQLLLPVERPTVSFSGIKAQNIPVASNKVNPEQFNLFGIASSSTGSMPEDTESLLRNAPLSTLKINVTGIVASSIPDDSIAIIATDGKQFSLGIGDNIPGYDAKVSAIFTEYVVINYQGRNEVLLLSRGEPAVTHSRDNENQPANENHPAEEAVTDRFAGQPENIFDCLTLSSVMVENKVKGYRLNPVVHSQLFYQVGLQNNDLAVAINGLDLRDAQQAQQVMEQLPELKELKITVERDGQLHDVFITVGDI